MPERSHDRLAALMRCVWKSKVWKMVRQLRTLTQGLKDTSTRTVSEASPLAGWSWSMALHVGGSFISRCPSLSKSERSSEHMPLVLGKSFKIAERCSNHLGRKRSHANQPLEPTPHVGRFEGMQHAFVLRTRRSPKRLAEGAERGIRSKTVRLPARRHTK